MNASRSVQETLPGKTELQFQSPRSSDGTPLQNTWSTDMLGRFSYYSYNDIGPAEVQSNACTSCYHSLLAEAYAVFGGSTCWRSGWIIRFGSFWKLCVNIGKLWQPQAGTLPSAKPFVMLRWLQPSLPEST